MYIFLKKSRLSLISSLIFFIFRLKLDMGIVMKQCPGYKVAVLFSLWFMQCVPAVKYIPDPEKDIDQWIRNFEQQRSFRYHHVLKTKSVYTKARGDCVIGRGEHISGVWYSAHAELPFEYIGLADIEYARDNGSWQVAPRGEQSDIFTQIERLLTFDKFEYISTDGEFLYRFKANIPFLAPDKRKEMVGTIKISQRNFLPSMIWAGLPDSSLFLQVDISHYNKVKRIKPPRFQWKNYLLTVDSLAVFTDYYGQIKRRLDGIGVEYHLTQTDRGIILSLTHEHNIEEIETLFAHGVVHAYALVETKENAQRVGYLEDDIASAVYLGDSLFDHNSIKNAKIKFDAVSRPYIMVKLTKKLALPTKIAVEVDGVIVGIATLDTSKKIDTINLYTIRRYYEMEILRATMVQTLPNIFISEFFEEIQ
ncbi:hypothetical protein AMJ52_01160 [candidate division TA06 bacterium DG_78]|uniref:Uncharacterized protein n=1 Tax=candidate division TA06 bacterium DG_78 TaxID=1703772 RepID=A0A0S7YHN0_UNCT6|nr:MAG: hypothetical protein AMJ52_01160 [candidate division TA06 bacterium DG_78]